MKFYYLIHKNLQALNCHVTAVYNFNITKLRRCGDLKERLASQKKKYNFNMKGTNHYIKYYVNMFKCIAVSSYYADVIPRYPTVNYTGIMYMQ